MPEDLTAKHAKHPKSASAERRKVGRRAGLGRGAGHDRVFFEQQVLVEKVLVGELGSSEQVRVGAVLVGDQVLVGEQRSGLGTERRI